jgi:hypothetical protein
MPACIHYASTLIPLEEIYTIPRPDPQQYDAYADKKTWRGDRPVQKEAKEVWTAGIIMEGRALERGYSESIRFAHANLKSLQKEDDRMPIELPTEVSIAVIRVR